MKFIDCFVKVVKVVKIKELINNLEPNNFLDTIALLSPTFQL